MNNEPPRHENLTQMCLNHKTNQHKLSVLLRNGFGTINITKKTILQKRQSIQNDLVTVEYPSTSNAKGNTTLFPRSIKWTVRLRNLTVTSYLYCRLFKKCKERVIFDQLYEFSLNFLRDNLSGFPKGNSCATALLKTCEDITTILDSKEHTAAAITIDLSKAFGISLGHIT